MHLEELQVESLEKAAKLSDEYVLTHKHFRAENKNVSSPQSKRAYIMQIVHIMVVQES